MERLASNLVGERLFLKESYSKTRTLKMKFL